MDIFSILNMIGGLSLFLYGMSIMGDGLSKMAGGKLETILESLTKKRIFAVLLGAGVTAIIQSSSASVGILQALCATGAVHYAVALPIIMGQNIGTCVTSIISSIGASKNAKRAAMIHLYFNLIGITVFMIAFYTINIFVDFAFLQSSANAAGIALIHSLFNIGATIFLFPISDGLVRLAEVTISGDSEKEATEENSVYIDERFLESPAFAMKLCRAKEIHKKELSFSKSARREIAAINKAVRDICTLTVDSFSE